MTFGSGPSLILFSCEEIDDNFHVSRNGVSVQAQIFVSLVINIFNNRKIDLFLSSPRIIEEMKKNITKNLINLSKFTEFRSLSFYPKSFVGVIFTALLNVSAIQWSIVTKYTTKS